MRQVSRPHTWYARGPYSGGARGYIDYPIWPAA
jgi:hypothetical protein